MKAKLFKNNKGDYYLIDPTKGTDANDEGFLLGSSRETNFQKLSKQNCDELFGVVDVKKMGWEYYQNNIHLTFHPDIAFAAGFNKAMELSKDKMFTLKDVMFGWDAGVMSRSILSMFGGELYTKHLESHRDSYMQHIQSLQQPIEIEVEIVMEKIVDETKVIGVVKGVKGSGDKITTYKSVHKLDPDGCLILKKI
jgi:hypothetical protein